MSITTTIKLEIPARLAQVLQRNIVQPVHVQYYANVVCKTCASVAGLVASFIVVVMDALAIDWIADCQ